MNENPQNMIADENKLSAVLKEQATVFLQDDVELQKQIFAAVSREANLLKNTPTPSTKSHRFFWRILPLKHVAASLTFVAIISTFIVTEMNQKPPLSTTVDSLLVKSIKNTKASSVGAKIEQVSVVKMTLESQAIKNDFNKLLKAFSIHPKKA